MHSITASLKLQRGALPLFGERLQRDSNPQPSSPKACSEQNGLLTFFTIQYVAQHIIDVVVKPNNKGLAINNKSTHSLTVMYVKKSILTGRAV